MDCELSFEYRLLGPFGELGGDLHAEDAFIRGFLLSARRTAVPPGLLCAVAQEALDLVDGVDGDLASLSLDILAASLPTSDSGVLLAALDVFISWLAAHGRLDALGLLRMRAQLSSLRAKAATPLRGRLAA